MSQLPLKAIDEFQALWKKCYGVELPREEAVKRAHEVFHLMELLFAPSIQEEIAEYPPTAQDDD